MMSKQNYVNFAVMLKQEKDTLTNYVNPGSISAIEELERIVGEIAYLFSLDNPLFDRERFFKACGMEVD